MPEAKQRTYISRRRVAEKALEIVDSVGVDGFNIRGLGAEIGVNGASLYYYYKSKDEILEDVARLVLRDLRLPDPESDDWLGWLIQCNLQYRDALLAHPNVVPVLLRGKPGRYRPRIVIDYLTRIFNEHGYDPDDLDWILEALESFTIGLVLVSKTTDGRRDRGPAHSDEQFRRICGGLIELMVDNANGEQPSTKRATKSTRNKAASVAKKAPATNGKARAKRSGANATS